MNRLAIQHIGDRDKRAFSLSDVAFTLSANAQSKEQKIIEILKI